MTKKLLLAAFLSVACFASVFAECSVGFWMDAPKNIGDKNVRGVAFGIPVSAPRYVDGAELSLIGSLSRSVRGFQGTLFGINKTEVITGCQASFVNFIEVRPVKTGVQVGFYNQSAEGGIQVGLVNNGKNNAKIQVGLICINENGLFPVMIFFNGEKDLFSK